MTKFVNTSGGTLILPGGVEIPNGEEAEISADEQKNKAVADWIEGGALSTPKEAKKAEGEAKKAEEEAKKAEGK